MERGYVKLWRKRLDSGVLKNHALNAFQDWCMLMATHKPRQAVVGWQKIPLEPGQFIFGRKKAAEELGMSEQSVRTCLAASAKADFLTIKSTNKFSVISLVNWGTYQADAQYGQPANQHAANQQVTTDKNGKNIDSYTDIKPLKNTSPEALRASDVLAELILENNPDTVELRDGKRQVAVSRWAIDLDRLHAIDGASWEQIEWMIRWTQRNTFWAPNIRSGAKLRKQWDRLVTQVRADKVKTQRAANQPNPHGIAAAAARVAKAMGIGVIPDDQRSSLEIDSDDSFPLPLLPSGRGGYSDMDG